MSYRDCETLRGRSFLTSLHRSVLVPGRYQAVDPKTATNTKRGQTRRVESGSFSDHTMHTPRSFPMTDSENDRRHAVALFRYGLIADLVQTAGTKGLYRRLAEKVAPDYTIPGSARTRIAPETLRDWLKRYRHGGFEALTPKPRADRGRSRGPARRGG